MTAPERREARLERLFWELRRKYLAASAGRIVAYDIRSDIDALKKFAGLSIHEKAELCERAVWATDGDPFVGGGTTARAAKETGRKCIAVERSHEYASIAANAIKSA